MRCKKLYKTIGILVRFKKSGKRRQTSCWMKSSPWFSRGATLFFSKKVKVIPQFGSLTPLFAQSKDVLIKTQH